jgi:hypothetical protein
VLVSTQPGASLTLTFKGSEIGLIDVADKDGADFEYAVDDAAPKKLAAPKDANRPGHAAGFIGARPRPHQGAYARAEVASAGTARVGGFLLNGAVADAFAGFTTLQASMQSTRRWTPITYHRRRGALPTFRRPWPSCAMAANCAWCFSATASWATLRFFVRTVAHARLSEMQDRQNRLAAQLDRL